MLAPYGEMDQAAGENIRLVLSQALRHCGGRTKRSGAGPWPPCSGWATPYEQVREVMGGLDTE